MQTKFKTVLNFKVILLVPLFFFIMGCSNFLVKEDKSHQFEKLPIKFVPPPLTTIPELDAVTHDVFKLYDSIESATDRLNQFQLYLTGVIKDPVGFLKETSNMSLQDAAQFAQRRYQGVVGLEPESIGKSMKDVSRVLQLKKNQRWKKSFRYKLRIFQRKLGPQLTTHVNRVKANAKSLKTSLSVLKILYQNLNLNNISVFLIHWKEIKRNLEVDVKVLAYLVTGLPTQLNLSRQLIKAALDGL